MFSIITLQHFPWPAFMKGISAFPMQIIHINQTGKCNRCCFCSGSFETVMCWSLWGLLLWGNDFQSGCLLSPGGQRVRHDSWVPPHPVHIRCLFLSRFFFYLLLKVCCTSLRLLHVFVISMLASVVANSGCCHFAWWSAPPFQPKAARTFGK